MTIVESHRNNALLLRAASRALQDEADRLRRLADAAEFRVDALSRDFDNAPPPGRWHVHVGNIGTVISSSEGSTRRAFERYLNNPPPRAEDTVALFDPRGELVAEGYLDAPSPARHKRFLASHLDFWQRAVAVEADEVARQEEEDR